MKKTKTTEKIYLKILNKESNDKHLQLNQQIAKSNYVKVCTTKRVSEMEKEH